MDDDYEGDDEAIVITGQKARGSVIGDIPPEDVLDSRDVRATGATSINELLEALAPQLGSAQGRGAERPILLLNGKRTSSFRELRDIPTEAIERVEILPEEVALKYGYAANQKVVNIVLRPRFRSTAVSIAGRAATEGGQLGGEGDVTRLMINRDGRTTINLRAEGNEMLTEDERDIVGDEDEARARSLIGSKQLLRGGVTVNRTVFGDVSATFNAEGEHNRGRSLARAWRHHRRSARPADPERQPPRRLRAQWQQVRLAMVAGRQWRPRVAADQDRPRRSGLPGRSGARGQDLGRPQRHRQWQIVRPAGRRRLDDADARRGRGAAQE